MTRLLSSVGTLTLFIGTLGILAVWQAVKFPFFNSTNKLQTYKYVLALDNFAVLPHLAVKLYFRFGGRADQSLSPTLSIDKHQEKELL